ncbi:MAG: glutaredoxin [Myxococcota bacterium]|nr:glutaredoxin [Myxococcota bacterium]
MNDLSGTPVERPLLHTSRMTPQALSKIAAFRAEVVRAVEAAVAASPVVVIGMAQNPHVKNVRRALDHARIAFTYLEYGSYFSQWRERLAIKLWSGWPTFPQVFVRAVLVGGEDLTLAALNDGSLQRMLGPQIAAQSAVVTPAETGSRAT